MERWRGSDGVLSQEGAPGWRGVLLLAGCVVEVTTTVPAPQSGLAAGIPKVGEEQAPQRAVL